jgi:hypothetical protein
MAGVTFRWSSVSVGATSLSLPTTRRNPSLASGREDDYPPLVRALRAAKKIRRRCTCSKVYTCTEAFSVPSVMRLEFGGGISGNMRLSF